jgi:nitroimidazol reductase NimA-like FMN-containing flavoprotein (pyridoxamine 5'-phosphate oxidase superfamily)
MPSTDIEVLGFRECLALLRSVPVGRLVFSANALPAIRPVNFALVDGQIVVRGARGSWADKLDSMVVAFEADQIDAATRTGWNVVVVGKAHLVTDIDEIVSLTRPLSRPWAPGIRDRFLKIDMERITGRRLVFTHVRVG